MAGIFLENGFFSEIPCAPCTKKGVKNQSSRENPHEITLSRRLDISHIGYKFFVNYYVDFSSKAKYSYLDYYYPINA